MNRSLLTALAVVILLAVPGFATAQASYDCSKATYASEIAVCEDTGLAEVDVAVDRAYRALLRRTPDPESLRGDQRRWVQDVRLCGADPYCLAESYADRLAFLTEHEVADVEQEAATGTESVPDDSDVQPEVSASASASEARSDKGGEPQARPVQRTGQASRDPLTGLIGGGMILGLIVVVLIALAATKALADYSMNRYGWPMILNWWNVLHLISFFSAWATYPLGGAVALAVVSGGLWLIVLTVNIRKTNLALGLVMTVVQPFVVFILWALYGVAKAKMEGRRI